MHLIFSRRFLHLQSSCGFECRISAENTSLSLLPRVHACVRACVRACVCVCVSCMLASCVCSCNERCWSEVQRSVRPSSLSLSLPRACTHEIVFMCLCERERKRRKKRGQSSPTYEFTLKVCSLFSLPDHESPKEKIEVTTLLSQQSEKDA